MGDRVPPGIFKLFGVFWFTSPWLYAADARIPPVWSRHRQCQGSRHLLVCGVRACGWVDGRVCELARLADLRVQSSWELIQVAIAFIVF